MNKNQEQLEQEFEDLYNKILDGIDWEIEDLDRLLELHLLLNKNRESYEERSENPHY